MRHQTNILLCLCCCMCGFSSDRQIVFPSGDGGWFSPERRGNFYHEALRWHHLGRRRYCTVCSAPIRFCHLLYMWKHTTTHTQREASAAQTLFLAPPSLPCCLMAAFASFKSVIWLNNITFDLITNKTLSLVLNIWFKSINLQHGMN